MKRILSALRVLAAKYWLPVALYGGVLVLFGWLLWWQLGTLTHGYSGQEMATLLDSLHLKNGIFQHPLNAPFTLLAHALLYFHHGSLFAVRLTATIFGLLTLSMFYWLVRYWHGQRAAVFGSILFGTSAWFLHTSRLGTPDVLLFGVLGLTAFSVWLKHSKGSLPVLLLIFMAAAWLYVPGMIWFIVAGLLWQWRALDRVFKQHLWMVTLAGLVLLATVAPLGLAIYHDPHLAKQLAGLPPLGWPQPLAVLRHIAEVPLQLIWRGPVLPARWLGHVPVLDAFTLAMVFLGAYVYAKHAKLVRTQLLVVILVIGAVLVGLQGDVSLTILVPFMYLLAAAGIGLLLDRWYTVFPRNPIAQGVGLGLVSLAVLAACGLGYRHYFVAWPAAPETTAAFPIPATASSDTIKK